MVYLVKQSRSLAKIRPTLSAYDSLCKSKTDIELERLFWKTLKHSPPLYGADVNSKTLFDPGVKFGLGTLKSVLSEGNKEVLQIPGVTTPYVYFGSWKALFGWHKEDMDLFAVNYLHDGLPKFWYSIYLDDNKKFEKFV